jgi:hypothetical protein
MPGLSRELVEHRLPIKPGLRPYKQRTRSFRLDILPSIKDKIDCLLEANFIRPCRYVEWFSNIVLVSPPETHRRETTSDTRSQEALGTAGGPRFLGQWSRSCCTTGLQGSPGMPRNLYPIRKVMLQIGSMCTQTFANISLNRVRLLGCISYKEPIALPRLALDPCLGGTWSQWPSKPCSVRTKWTLQLMLHCTTGTS